LLAEKLEATKRLLKVKEFTFKDTTSQWSSEIDETELFNDKFNSELFFNDEDEKAKGERLKEAEALLR